jgi:transposase-like protein
VRLHVARSARCRVVGRQTRVIEKHASQRGVIVAERVVRRGVVVCPPRLRENARAARRSRSDRAWRED